MQREMRVKNLRPEASPFLFGLGPGEARLWALAAGYWVAGASARLAHCCLGKAPLPQHSCEKELFPSLGPVLPLFLRPVEGTVQCPLSSCLMSPGDTEHSVMRVLGRLYTLQFFLLPWPDTDSHLHVTLIPFLGPLTSDISVASFYFILLFLYVTIYLSVAVLGMEPWA